MSSGLFNSKPLHISKVDSFEISIENWFDMVGLERKYWCFIGSIGKKEFSGDVDIAVLSDSLEDWKDTFEQLGLECRIFKGFNQISFGYPFEGQMVQVDLMLTTDLEWSKFIYYSPNLSTLESKYGGIYRKNLLVSLIKVESINPIENGYERLILNNVKGLFLNKKDDREMTQESTFITKSVPEFLEYIDLKPPALTFEQIYKQIQDRPKFREIMEEFEKSCLTSKIEIPDYDEVDKTIDVRNSEVV